ncbi:Protein prenylyltransferase superfamily protein [Euphorbia peplus]|nr:Protein prenylyltransferase superfamily protein [Euphorbia peplus]
MAEKLESAGKEGLELGLGLSKAGLELLKQLQHILDSDPLIDEVGFVHPSQFASLNKQAKGTQFQSKDGILTSQTNASDNQDTSFWCKDHKLGISTLVILPLYQAAKHAFIDATTEYKKRLQHLCHTSGNEIHSCTFSPLESQVMKHSKALLLLSSDFGTAWNSRKLVLLKKQHMSMFIDELLMSSLVLSCSPKSEQAWCHRRWVIKMVAGKCSNMQQIVGRESELVEKIAERSKMNYRAWNHRCWLVSFMTIEQVLLELKSSKNWAKLHIADNSCFHYLTRLMHRILEEACQKHAHESSNQTLETYQIWQEELHWNKELIKRYIGREALWLYRRFLSLCWMRHFANKPNGLSQHINLFLDDELNFVNSFSTIADDNYEDFEAQALHSTAYILWLIKQIPKSQGIELRKKLNAGNWKTILSTSCPDRSLLWDNIAAYLESP